MRKAYRVVCNTYPVWDHGAAVCPFDTPNRNMAKEQMEILEK